eukprot:TRINITY_DN10524_c0_g1_i1.p1 TRINITY_DN10524_c0_g1~~TRINITY_DN10524_c0_g1_i1.p1  ORF type:complete len:230 (-),score=55.87 TRINITY_DN10524_c0_g1_i1:61-699(-)
MSLTLYSYWRSSCSYRVRICLAYKGLDYTYKAVDLKVGAQKAADYTALNPNQTVPALLLPSKEVIHQSIAIAEYLEEAYPEKSLLPPTNELVDRANVRCIVGMIAADIQPLQNLRVLKKLSTEVGPRIEHAHEVIVEGFTRVEKQLEQTAGDYCVGDAFTLADAFLVPQVYNANRYKVDLTKFPIIHRVYEKCMETDWVEKARPANQVDANT